MQVLGIEMDAAGLVKELLKDRAYFDKSQGGVTLSGGEPTLQPDFTAAVARGLKQAGVSVALDTCGACSWTVLENLLSLADVVLYDLKFIDPERHRQWTGRTNQVILKNLLLAGEVIWESGGSKKLWIRTPLIPGASATAENLQAIGDFIKQNLDSVVQRWELYAFNNLCRDKYRRLGLDWQFAGVPLMARAQLDQAGAWARSRGLDPQVVSVTGAARLEDG